MEDVIAVVKAHELRREERATGQLERGLCLPVDDSLRRSLLLGGGEALEIDDGKREAHGRIDELDGPAVLHAEVRAQDLVAPRDLEQRPLEERDMELPAQAEPHGDVVCGA